VSERIEADVSRLAEGQLLELRLGERDILVCHAGGAFHAIDALCTHARVSLADGHVLGFVLECPVHGARFDVRDGSVRAGPARRALRSYVVEPCGPGRIRITG
jgi:3-phenylpropionate/trans-cinnamate dioxygenase ferredoxin subunit